MEEPSPHRLIHYERHREDHERAERTHGPEPGVARGEDHERGMYQGEDRIPAPVREHPHERRRREERPEGEEGGSQAEDDGWGGTSVGEQKPDARGHPDHYGDVQESRNG